MHCNRTKTTLKTAERNKWGKRKSLLAPPIKFTFFLHPLNRRSSILSQRTDGTIPIGPLEPCSGTAVIPCTFPRVGYCEGDASSVGCNAAPFFAHCNRRRRRKEAGGRRLSHRGRANEQEEDGDHGKCARLSGCEVEQGLLLPSRTPCLRHFARTANAAADGNCGIPDIRSAPLGLFKEGLYGRPNFGGSHFV